jgi:hypothetical protein
LTARAIPLADVARLARAARRTTIARALLVALIVALVVATAAAARSPDLRQQTFVPEGSSGIVVLDLSASISTETYQRIGATLGELASGGGRYGLVLYSDVAYEALPPRTPAAELGPFVRYFTLPPQETPGFLPQFPVNPWSTTFSAGTRISSGLALARSVIRRERLQRPAVLLVSDLDDDPIDVPRLRRLMGEYERGGIPLNVVALNPSPEDERFFRRLLREPDALSFARLPSERVSEPTGATFPIALAVLAVAAALALAGLELWGARLTWRTA